MADETARAKRITDALLAWYDRNRRTLPWRAAPGVSADPYAVWLSEIMLQQTTVKVVGPYFSRFLARWPTVTALAAADEDDVLAAWAGLGYYARARKLHACARVVASEHGGQFPTTEAALLDLPGVGPYTAAAVASIAFDAPTVPVDGNIERVTARLFDIRAPLPKAKAAIRAAASKMALPTRSGDLAQGLMDLGSSVCTPRKPSCLTCPLRLMCRGFVAGTADTLPVKAPKRPKPERYGDAFLAVRADGAVLLRKRPNSGLLAGMLEVPSTPWCEASDASSLSTGKSACAASAPLKATWVLAPLTVVHVFTHFRLSLRVYAARVPINAAMRANDGPNACRWVARADLYDAALPSVMRKVIAAGFEAKHD
ncbi:MAG: A/G-specific adenine glycosylase [Pseudomonadota bacterium]